MDFTKLHPRRAPRHEALGRLRRPRSQLLLWAAATMALMWGARSWVVTAQTGEQAEQLCALLISFVESRRDQIRSEASQARTEVGWRAADLTEPVSALLGEPFDRRLSESPAQNALRETFLMSQGGDKAQRFLREYLVVGPDGRILASSTNRLVGKTFSNLLNGMVGEALAGRTVVTAGSDPILSLHQGQNQLLCTAAAAAIQDTDGHWIAALVLYRTVLAGASNLEAVSTHDAIRTSFFTADGRWLGVERPSETAREPDNNVAVGYADLPLPPAMLVERHAPGENLWTNTAGYPGRDRRRVVGAATFFPDLHFGLVAEMDFNRAYRPVTALARTMAVMTMAAALLLALLLLVSRYTSPTLEGAPPAPGGRMLAAGASPCAVG